MEKDLLEQRDELDQKLKKGEITPEDFYKSLERIYKLMSTIEREFEYQKINRRLNRILRGIGR